MTDDLVAFLRARLAEDERLARSVEASVGAYRAGEPYSDGSGSADIDAFPSYPWGQEAVELEFMARWHPRTVLAEVESKRRIIDEIVPSLEAAIEKIENEWVTDWRPGRAEDLLRLLALPYAGHSDYREEWKP